MIRSPIEEKDKHLFIDGVSVSELAEKFDTPLYVMSERKVKKNYRQIMSALKQRYEKVRILYSAKANSNLRILQIFEKEGAGLDAVSPGEVYLAKKAGFSSDKILFTGTSVRDDEMKYVLEEGVIINFDALSQLERLLRMAKPNLVSMRINPHLGAGHHEHVVTGGQFTKFGVWDKEALEAYERAQDEGVERFGIQMHIGSGIMRVEPFQIATEKLLALAGTIREKLGIEFEFIDIGGGIGVPYKPDKPEMDLDLLSERLGSLFKEKIAEYTLGKPELWFELGRYLVAEAGVLITKVNTLKTTPYRNFAGVDAGFNTLLRPILYGSYHHILVEGKTGMPLYDEYDVCGPICETGDVLARSRRLPKLSEDDLLVVLNTGAYGFSMSSEYNSRPKPAEVLVKEGRYELIRERGSFQDLIKDQEGC